MPSTGSMLNGLLVLLRACQFATALMLLGTLSFLILLRRWQRAEDNAAQATAWGYRRLAAWTLGIAVLTLVPWLLAQASVMAGSRLTVPLVETVALDTQFGQIMLWRLAILGLLGVLLALSPRLRWLEVAAAATAAMALALLVWVGHVAAAAQASSLQIGAQVAHLLALGIWIGGLPAFLWFLRRSDADGVTVATAAQVTRAFSRICVLCVIVVVASGWLNAAYLLRSSADLIHTAYGGLLLAKLAVLALLLAVAADNLLRQRPGLESAARTPTAPDAGCLRRLRLNVLIETILAVVILLLVALLGTASPPA